MQEKQPYPDCLRNKAVSFWIANKNCREKVTAYHVDCLKDLCYAFGSDIVNEKGNPQPYDFGAACVLPTKSKRKS